MSENQDESVNFWAVGAGTPELTKFFIKNNMWEDASARSGNPVNKPLLDQIKKGDYLLMQTSTGKGTANSRSLTKLKAVGKVIGRVKDNYYTFLVTWDTKDPHNFPKDFNGIWYSKTIEPTRADEMLRYAKKILGLSSVVEKV